MRTRIVYVVLSAPPGFSPGGAHAYSGRRHVRLTGRTLIGGVGTCGWTGRTQIGGFGTPGDKGAHKLAASAQTACRRPEYVCASEKNRRSHFSPPAEPAKTCAPRQPHVPSPPKRARPSRLPIRYALSRGRTPRWEQRPSCPPERSRRASRPRSLFLPARAHVRSSEHRR